MTAPTIGVKDLLVAAGIGTFGTGTWPIYISKLPDESDQAIALYDSGGLAPFPRWLLDFPDVSVNVRGKDYESTYNKMKAVKDALLSLPAQTINSDRWDGIISVGEFSFVGHDKKDRPMFSATYRIFIEPADVVGDYRSAL